MSLENVKLAAHTPVLERTPVIFFSKLVVSTPENIVSFHILLSFTNICWVSSRPNDIKLQIN